MKRLQDKIEARKQAIDSKKEHLGHDYQMAKRKLTSKSGLSLMAVGGFAIGFLLLPKKFKVLRSIFKAYSLAATLRGFLDLVPHHEGSRKPHPTYSKHHH